jgi:hypothetical protein
MPNEFWREVVDRVAQEVPGTLLLAEAFWLMEGYFVRTLGMHRVYNSAFMVMLRDEDNAKYRSVLKNTLEFDPDIMKRYVNFMSNPDERTAIDQFGKGDKCFGVAVMMSTLPGLPMFGHGQIEGFTEKYGMEYRWPRYEENPDAALVARHDREIAPLLKRRWLFAESANFLLYDFFHDNGSVDENVFAYSNRNGGERALVVYNNHYGETHGTIDFSTAYADKGAGQLRQRRLSEGLGLSGDGSVVLAWRNSLTGLEYLRRANEVVEHGLRLDLHAYQAFVLLEWRELRSTAQYPWHRLADHLNGRGVANLEDALVDLELEPVHAALRKLLDPAMVRLFADSAEHPRAAAPGDRMTDRERSTVFDRAWELADAFLRVARPAYAARLAKGAEAERKEELTEISPLAFAYRQRLRAAMRMPVVEALSPAPWTAAARRMLPSPSPEFTATAMWGPILAWCALELLAEVVDKDAPEQAALDIFDRLRLRETLGHAFAALGFEGDEAWRVAARIKVVLLASAGVGKVQDEPEKPATTAEKNLVDAKLPAPTEKKEKDGPVSAKPSWDGARAETNEKGASEIGLAPDLWLDPDVRWLTGVHRAEGHEYLVREKYEELLWWMLMPALLRVAESAAPSRAAMEVLGGEVARALAQAEAAGYRVDVLSGRAALANEKKAPGSARGGEDEESKPERAKMDEPSVKAEPSAEDEKQAAVVAKPK